MKHIVSENISKSIIMHLRTKLSKTFRRLKELFENNLKFSEARVSPTMLNWERRVPQIATWTKSNFNHGNNTIFKELTKLYPEASHEIKIYLNHFKR